MTTKNINTIAEIPMKCTVCDWVGNQSECKLIDPKEFIPNVITAKCPKCGAKASQTEDCKYSFKKGK